jgi:hypothetical protein
MGPKPPQSLPGETRGTCLCKADFLARHPEYPHPVSKGRKAVNAGLWCRAYTLNSTGIAIGL